MSASTAREIRTVVEGFAFLEGPRWYDGRLLVSDFFLETVTAIDVATGEVEVLATVPNRPSGLGHLPDGRLLVVSMLDRRILRREHDGTLVEHADLSHLPGSNLNDMVVDDDGNAYVGDFGSAVNDGEPMRPTSLYRVTPDGEVSIACGGLMIPNGAVISPDGKTLTVAESGAARLTAFTVEADGTLTSPRLVATIGTVPTADTFAEALGEMGCCVDGMALDAEGGLWVADALGGRVLRVLDGDVVETIDTMPLGVSSFAVALGGPEGRTLFIAAGTSHHEDDALAQMAARVLAVEVDVPHAGRP